MLTEKDINAAFESFAEEFEPLETKSSAVGGGELFVLVDKKTGAHFCECHISASKLIELGTVDVPLDPEDQADYRANREVVEDAYAFERMKEDALARRSFSNIVAEYTKEFDSVHPLKIIGGQHRFEAISAALKADINEYHGVKVYLGLNMDQRLDVQLISNTNIATSGDLFDRMHETVKGPQLRDWCQSVGLLPEKVDFADRRERGGRISVQLARTFIANFYLGQSIDTERFNASDTTPQLCATGRSDEAWDALRSKRHNLWKDEALRRAGKEFARLADAQRAAYQGRKGTPLDYPQKAMNAAVLASWAYVAGMLQKNPTRLTRHYALAETTGRDPLNASILAAGKHRTDPENYRGLGYRTDAKERGRFVELFALQAENGKGINKAAVEAAIAEYHAKRAVLEAQKAKARVSG